MFQTPLARLSKIGRYLTSKGVSDPAIVIIWIDFRTGAKSKPTDWLSDHVSINERTVETFYTRIR